MNTIYIEIAAYRDDELSKTIKSLLLAAKFPERLRFGIVHQYGPETQGCLSEYLHDTRFRIREIEWRDARGVGRARRTCDEMYAGEDFFLQIDSHMRAQQDWDTRLESEWGSCDDPRAILSSYPPAYRYDEHDKEQFVDSAQNRLVVHDMFMDDIPTFFGKALPDRADARGAFVAGGLQFGPGEVCRAVPYEARICFIGEEIVHSLRLFAAGYHVYSVKDQVLSHLYIRSENQKNAHHFWKDFLADAQLTPIYHEMNNVSYETVRAYLSGKHVLVAGSIVHEFENFCGVDFAQHKIHPATYTLAALPMATDDSWRKDAIPPQKHA